MESKREKGDMTGEREGREGHRVSAKACIKSIAHVNSFKSWVRI